jgi:hypothetical protein
LGAVIASSREPCGDYALFRPTLNRAARRRWAALIHSIYEADPLVCPRCRGPMRIIAFIAEPWVI